MDHCMWEKKINNITKWNLITEITGKGLQYDNTIAKDCCVKLNVESAYLQRRCVTEFLTNCCVVFL